LLGAPKALHVSGEEERLLQSLGEVSGIPPLRLPNQSVPTNGSTIHLQPRGLSALPSTYFGFVSVVYRLGPLVLRVLGLLLLLGALLRCHLTFLQVLCWPLLP